MDAADSVPGPSPSPAPAWQRRRAGAAGNAGAARVGGGAGRVGADGVERARGAALPGAAHAADPLVVDLDGTLLHTDTLLECALLYLKQGPLGLLHMLGWLLRGPAVLKRELARRVTLDLSILPFNAALMAFAAAERSRGRRVILATAADRAVAEQVAQWCGLDEVLASDGRINLKGARKLAAVEALLPGGFAYAGDSRADLVLWARASEAILVGRPGWARRTARRFATVRVFPTPSPLRALAKCARPHQWAKNALVFVPGVLAGQLSSPHAMLASAACFAALCVTASSTYLLNDLWDVNDDRRHWTKCRRPIASGRLPLRLAMLAIPLGLAAGMLIAAATVPKACAVLLAYIGLTLAYSFSLKRVPVLDVTVLASLFTLRLLLGIVATGVFASPWLLVFSMFLFSSLCFAKRYVEVERAAERGARVTSRGYRPGDSTLIFSLGLGTGIASILIMVLYVIFDAFRQTFYGNTAWLWAFPVIIFLWFSRVWLVAVRGELNDDPVAFAVRDRPSLLLGGAIMTAFLLAWSGMFA